MSVPYIDIHTHTRAAETSRIISIQNGLFDVFPAAITEDISLGIHPWVLGKVDTEDLLAKIEAELENPFVKAVGECGLDKTIDTPMTDQENIFMCQILLSEQYNKPMILHCVKAYNEVIRIRKQLSPKCSWILHGFNANRILAGQLYDHGILPSFGAALFNPKSKAAGVLAELKDETFFLETDDSTYTIEDVYKQAAGILNISVEALKIKLFENYKGIFG